jgi:hypothetical protein
LVVTACLIECQRAFFMHRDKPIWSKIFKSKK